MGYYPTGYYTGRYYTTSYYEGGVASPVGPAPSAGPGYYALGYYPRGYYCPGFYGPTVTPTPPVPTPAPAGPHGKLFQLGPIKRVIQQALDDLITELGKPCRLIYPPLWVSCRNCLIDPVGNKSSNYYRTGGPMEFAPGTICPLCNGKGKIEQEVSETIMVLCSWDVRDFYKPIPPLDLRVPFGTIQTKGYLTDLPKIRKADRAVFQPPIEPYLRMTYKLAGEPADVSNIIQGRYCVATWNRSVT